MTSYLVTPYQ